MNILRQSQTKTAPGTKRLFRNGKSNAIIVLKLTNLSGLEDKMMKTAPGEKEFASSVDPLHQ